MKTLACYVTLLVLLGSCNSSAKFSNDLQYQKGSSLNEIKPITLEAFMERWMENITLKPGWFNTNLCEMQKDSVYTYFKKETLKTPLYYKVRNDELATVDYKSVEGQLIFEKFEKEIIPHADKDLVKSYTHTSFNNSNRRYDWHYNRQNKEMIIECYWKEHWGFKKIIDKKYIAVYSIDKKDLSKKS